MLNMFQKYSVINFFQKSPAGLLGENHGLFRAFGFLARVGLELLVYLVRARKKAGPTGSGFSPIHH